MKQYSICNAIKCNKLCFFTSVKNATTEHDGTYLKYIIHFQKLNFLNHHRIFTANFTTMEHDGTYLKIHNTFPKT